jgi:hypothetical protein
MKLTLNKDELFTMIKKFLPPEMIPVGLEVSSIEETGPSYNKDFTITFIPKEEVK